MEQERKLTRDERHPNGDLSHHTFLDDFADMTSLNEIETKVALRTLKRLLEQRLALELSDELFIDLFKAVPFLAPARPFCALSVLGFVQPIQQILKSHGINDIIRKTPMIMAFWGLNSNSRSFTIMSESGLE